MGNLRQKLRKNQPKTTAVWTAEGNPPLTLYWNNCLSILRRIDSESIDAVVTDPPYGLSFMGKRWDYDVPSVEIWEEVLRVLKPGGHLLSFGGTRTYHRLVVNIEDAGFDIRDQLQWLYGSGFPKSMDVPKAIDREGGGSSEHLEARKLLAQAIRDCRERSGVTRKELKLWFPQYGSVTLNWERLDAGFRIPTEDAYQVLVDRLGLPNKWRKLVRAEDRRRKVDGVSVDRQGDGTVYGLAHDGGRYEATTDAARQWKGWGTALKPANEIICLARKPLVGTVATNVQQHGTGALNIDGCKIGTDVITTHSRGKCTAFPKRPGEKTVEESGRKVAQNLSENFSGAREGRWPANVILDEEAGALLDEQCSGASRFFYCAKASTKERNRGCGKLEKKPAGHYAQDAWSQEHMGSTPDGKRKLQANTHPTVKPVALMRYLVRLVTPPGGTVLDPFMGSGTTGIAARQGGWGFVGIELEREWYDIAQQRIYRSISALQRRVQDGKPRKKARKRKKNG